MNESSVWRTRAVSVAAIFLFCAAAAMAAMQIKTTIIAVPEDEKPVLLAGLDYPGAGWTIEFTSIRLDVDSDPSADPAKIVWTMTANSSRPMVQKVIIELFVEDDAGNR